MEVKISAGTIQNILTENKDTWLDEKRDILQAGLSQGYTQTDTTGAKAGLLSPAFFVYLPQKKLGSIVNLVKRYNKTKI
jgi:hypothetical protein